MVEFVPDILSQSIEEILSPKLTSIEEQKNSGEGTEEEESSAPEGEETKQ